MKFIIDTNIIISALTKFGKTKVNLNKNDNKI